VSIAALEVSSWLTDGPDRLREIMGKAAPGVAGAATDWTGQVGTATATDPVPGLWRIGTGHVRGSSHLDGVGEFPVGVPLLDESHLAVTSTPEARPSAEVLAEALVLRVMSHFRPGLVRLRIWSASQFTGSLGTLLPLTRGGLLTVHDPQKPSGLLAALTEQIHRVHAQVHVDGHSSLAARAAVTGTRDEPWTVAVLFGTGTPLREADHQQLERVLRDGLACGISVVLVDLPVDMAAPTEQVFFSDSGAARTSMTGKLITVTPDLPLSRDDVTTTCVRIADEWDRLRNRVGTFADLLPEQWGTESSAHGLVALVGFVKGEPIARIEFGNAAPHWLVGGPTGSGKTNVILAEIISLATRYSPDELELHLIDLKEGVSFAQFAPGRRDQTWLPHVRTVGFNINADLEFALELLRYLADELRRRATAFRRHEVTSLADLRREDPNGHWPRIVAVIDEFQVLYENKDDLAKEAAKLFEDIARRARSFGIHLEPATQDISTISEFWGKAAVFKQFPGRVALPLSTKILDDGNDPEKDLPPYHAIINSRLGVPSAHIVARIPNAIDGPEVARVQSNLCDRYGHDYPAPRLFDGSKAPRAEDLILAANVGQAKAVVLGQRMDLKGTPATVTLPDRPGRNIAVVGTNSDARRVMDVAVDSLATMHEPGTARFILAPFTGGPTSEKPIGGHADMLDVIELRAYRTAIAQLASEITYRAVNLEHTPTYLIVWGVDEAESQLDRGGLQALSYVLHEGPSVGVHTIGLWASALRCKNFLGNGTDLGDLGALVGLNVQGNDFSKLLGTYPDNSGWSPREARGLFYDRSRMAKPEVIVVPGEVEEL
jgi:S-DNA-T family DNA segregation ATPase FtsK/SpoIIIE